VAIRQMTRIEIELPCNALTEQLSGMSPCGFALAVEFRLFAHVEIGSLILVYIHRVMQRRRQMIHWYNMRLVF
jgi:hypothetical protein